MLEGFPFLVVLLELLYVVPAALFLCFADLVHFLALLFVFAGIIFLFAGFALLIFNFFFTDFTSILGSLALLDCLTFFLAQLLVNLAGAFSFC